MSPQRLLLDITCARISVCVCVCTVGDVKETLQFVLGCKKPLNVSKVKQTGRETLQLILTQIDMI